MDLSTTGRGNAGNGSGGDGDVCLPPPEYRHPVYHHLTDTGAMSGGRVTARGVGVDEAVGAGHTHPGAYRVRDEDEYEGGQGRGRR